MLTGICAMIPANIKSDTPFPIPFSEIISPSHTKNMDPAVTVAIRVTRSNKESCVTSPWLFKSVTVASDCKAARGIVRNLENWLNLAFPSEPDSRYISLRFGKIIVKSCIMIVAVM